jgi:hypothetical protein
LEVEFQVEVAGDAEIVPTFVQVSEIPDMQNP